METESAAFDSHDFVKRLISAGMPEAQAEILARGQSRRNEHLATQRDIKALEAAIKLLEVNLTRDLKDMEHKLTIKLGAFIGVGITLLGALITRLTAAMP